VVFFVVETSAMLITIMLFGRVHISQNPTIIILCGRFGGELIFEKIFKKQAKGSG